MPKRSRTSCSGYSTSVMGAFKKKARASRQTSKMSRQAAFRIQNPELKYNDVPAAGVAVVASGSTIALLSSVAEGDDNTDRDGRRILPKGLKLRLFTLCTDVLPAAGAFRVVLFKDKQSNGTLPTIGQLLQTSGVTYQILSPFNNSNRSRFTILSDQLIEFSSDGSSNGKIVQAYIDLGSKFPTDVTTYTAAAAGIANCQEGHYYLAVIAGGVDLTCEYYTRFTFIDA